MTPPRLKILNIVGARPNFMKIAPLAHAMARHPGIEARLVHTGQHYDANLSRVFFEDLGIPRPDVDLGIGGGGREEQIARIAAAFEPILVAESPDLVLVVGDVNSTIACAGVARRHGVKVAHVEAGLRSFDEDMPEEHNRRETDRISDFLFVTEESGVENIRNEGLPGAVHFVGNVMIDTLVANLSRARQSGVLEGLGLVEGEYLVSTFHRPSNVDHPEGLDRLLDTIEALCRIAPLVLPLHPRTRGSLERHGRRARLDAVAGLVLCEPLGYLDFLRLLSSAQAVVTDSGGIQEETTFLGVPCLTMRENTERPITVTLGTNELVGGDRHRLLEAVTAITEGRGKKGQIPPLWDGHAAERVVEVLRAAFGLA